MGKRKTRKEKQLADLRKQSSHLHHQDISESSGSTGQHTYSLSFSHQSELPRNVVTTIPTIRHDLQKTLIVSVTIAVLQLLLFLILKNHILALPWLRY